MRGPWRRDRGSDAPSAKTGARINLLLGERRRTVALLAACSVVSGFTEAATLAVVAQIAVSLAGSSHTRLRGLHIHAPIHTLILIAFALAVIRLVMQFPLSILPSRIAGDVQASLRQRLFHA